ncbi:MAG: 16S rRNA (guanine(966)-N(2))-methyltransferase RsmD [Micrococcaceae bacterium]
MRIIAGALKGQQLQTLTGDITRPTTDKVKEALFSILASYNMLEDCVVLDLFAGSGSLGLEAASRGAIQVDFVENHPKALKIVKKNCELSNKKNPALLNTFFSEAQKYLKNTTEKYDLIFIDPPYNFSTENINKILAKLVPLIVSHSIVIIERSSRTKEIIEEQNFSELFRKKYGETLIIGFELRQ